MYVSEQSECFPCSENYILNLLLLGGMANYCQFNANEQKGNKMELEPFNSLRN